MTEFTRRYFLFASSARGKQTIAGLIIGIAIVLDLIAASLSSSRAKSNTVATLYAAALGVLLAGLVYMIINRKRSS
jgi:multisubunit Na+/H+ antiporter MnhB subunit